jgi:hypothetical protein
VVGVHRTPKIIFIIPRGGNIVPILPISTYLLVSAIFYTHLTI